MSSRGIKAKLTLGTYSGGMSHFSNHWGMVCDNVKSFEVTLTFLAHSVKILTRSDLKNRLS